MANDSSEAGYLAPAAAFPYDTALENILHDIVMGITGLPGDLVRPRWQTEPPQQPDFNTDWCAFGIVRTSADTFAYEGHDPAGDGHDTVDRDELLYVLHSFYGPNAHGYCERFRDGFEISQNRDAAIAAGIGLVEVGEATILPALLKEKWVKRVDATVTYRRRTSRTYPVLTIVGGDVELNTEIAVINITIP